MHIHTSVEGGGVSLYTYRASKHTCHLNHYWKEMVVQQYNTKKGVNFALFHIVKQTQHTRTYKHCNYAVVIIVRMTDS